MRLDRMLSNLNYGSRKEVKKIIKDGLVTINDKVSLDDSYNVKSNDVVKIDGQEVYYNDNLTMVINKPQGYICSNIDEDYPSILNLIEEKYRRLNLNVAGRLDQDTTGLVILSNNGELIHHIISPKHNIQKVYEVLLENKLSNQQLILLKSPMLLQDGKGETYLAKALAVNVLEENKVLLTIDEGKYHQVKKMVEHIGNNVVGLKRIQIGDLKLDSLKEKEYRILSEEDILKLRWTLTN